VAKTVIVSDETIRRLIEAPASMAAWYYQMSDALRNAGAGVAPPSDAMRKAYVAAFAQHFPELAHVAQTISEPQAYVPPPAVPIPAQVVENEGIVVAPPPDDHLATPDMIAGAEPAPAPPPAAPEQPQQAPAAELPAPPAIVDPTKVKYD